MIFVKFQCALYWTIQPRQTDICPESNLIYARWEDLTDTRITTHEVTDDGRSGTVARTSREVWRAAPVSHTDRQTSCHPLASKGSGDDWLPWPAAWTPQPHQQRTFRYGRARGNVLLRPIIGLLYRPWMIVIMVEQLMGLMADKENQRTRRNHAPEPLWSQ
jgi:hypothetical protein